MEKIEKQLKIFLSRREYIFQSMQILYDLSKDIHTDQDKLRSFRSRYKRIEETRTEFVDVIEKIDEIQITLKPETVVDMKQVLAFDELYYKVVAAADSIAPPLSASLPSAAGEVTIDSKPSLSASRARLPKIDLSKFDSNIENWQTFYDTFVTLVHNNDTISPVEKFHYLISCPAGPALTIVKGVPVANENYTIAFNALLDRYENKRIIAANYLEKILNFTPLKSPVLNDLLKLTNTLYESVNALQNMKIQNLGEYILFHLASRVLDSDTRKRFEIQNVFEIPTFSNLLKFLQDYVKLLETSEHQSCTKPRAKPFESRPKASKNYNTTMFASQSTQFNSFKCICCYFKHSIYKCPKFLGFNTAARLNFIKQRGICTNCLKSGHGQNSCPSKTNCLTCGQGHHTLLHPSTTVTPSCSDPVAENNTSSSVHHGTSRALVLLGTCTLLARAASGPPQLVRALINSGAQDCFITATCARRLGLPIRRANLTVSGLGHNTVTDCVIQPRGADEPSFNIRPIVMTKLTSKLPTVKLPSTIRHHYKHLTLADRDFHKPAEVDLLLGAELFSDIYDGQRIAPGPGLPVAMHSIFGWILTGKLDSGCRPPPSVSSLVASTLAIDEVVQRFWEVEEPPQYRIVAPEDEECERLYSKLVHQNLDGKYVVPILLKECNPVLGHSYNNSLRRFINLEKRLTKHNQLKGDYVTFMRDYANLDHMRLVNSQPPVGKYLIPHHCVIRPDSTTIKLRVVFDASSKSSNGLSLNDLVYTGPKLQANIIDILTKFRLHTFVFTSDISKMYRAILIRPEDRPWQHILWRDSPSETMTEYELRTVTYGVSSSPYLAIRTLQQLAADHGASYPSAANVIRHNVYMDDIITGTSSLEEAHQLKLELTQLLHCAKFELHKWSSNSREFLQSLSSEHVQVPKAFVEKSKESTLKILGVQWDPKGEYFTYSASEIRAECSKRSILSNVARIFDPLGWLTPVTLIAKLLLQDLWRLKLSWDEPIPYDLTKVWNEFVSELNNLKFIQLPRLVVPRHAEDFQLVGFCDGSTKAYACCVYLRAVKNNSVHINLLIAKSKVAPLKPFTVNRLELCGAALLSRCLKHMFTLLSDRINITDQIAFTDSSTVLSWLNTEPHKLKTFVAHRVVQAIDSVPSKQWRHVSTHDNPADLCSRGLSCSQLADCSRWWSGPEWLSSELARWPTCRELKLLDSCEEMKSSSLVFYTSDKGPGDNLFIELIDRFSSFTRLIRVVATCLRFIKNVRTTLNHRLKDSLRSVESNAAIDKLIEIIQYNYFASELISIKENRPCTRSLQKLSPFIDSSGLLRVGGRLKNSDLPDQTKHPYLLPKLTRLSSLIVDHFHVKYLHCGPRTLQSLIQRRFWILGIRNLIRSRLSKCVICFRHKPLSCQPVMGDLPASRIEQGSCFENIGIDFGGLFVVKKSRRRNARSYKAWVCLLICLATKAVHLELVTELSTEAFIAALDRFVARRGICRSILTDCGTNFIGAKRYLNEMFVLLEKEKSAITNELTNRSITWNLNPPGAPNFGGIFESGIKSTKYHLKRVVGSPLTFEEFVTVLTKIEAMLNSRPLCVLSSDPHEVNVLTPGHFLIGRPLASLPEQQFEDSNGSLKSRWQMIQRLSQSFWRIWQRDYLHTLQQKSKWFTNQRRDPEVGDVVILLKPNLAATEWRLGRIINVFPGKDTKVRVVSVRTAKGVYTRPARKVCPLPSSDL